MDKLKTLLLLHGWITLAAAIVLIIDPALIPQTVDINIGKEHYMLCYLLAAAEIAIAYLSFQSRTFRDQTGLRAVASTIIIFHLMSGILEGYALYLGMSNKIIANIVLRGIIVILFYYFGIFNMRKRKLYR